MKKSIIITFIIFIAVLVGISTLKFFKNTTTSTLRIGVLTHNSPYSYYSNKKLSGFEVELGHALAKKNNQKVQFITANNRQHLEKLIKNHDIDLAFGNFDKNSISSNWHTTDVYLYPQNVLFTDKHNHISSVDNLKDKKVGMLKQGNQYKLLKNLDIKPKFYSSISALITALQNKKIKACILTAYEYTNYLKNNIELTADYAQSVDKDNQSELTLIRIKDAQVTAQTLVALTDKNNSKLQHSFTELQDSNEIINLSQKYFSQDLTKP